MENKESNKKTDLCTFCQKRFTPDEEVNHIDGKCLNQEKEFNLRSKRCYNAESHMWWYYETDIEEFIERVEEENSDFKADIIALIELNDDGKEDLIAKIRRLCKAHKEERDKLAGAKLT